MSHLRLQVCSKPCFPERPTENPCSRLEIPCSVGQGNGSKYGEITGEAETLVSENSPIFEKSLFFSLLAGNCEWRPVRSTLRRQPASTVSRIHAAAYAKKLANTRLFTPPLVSRIPRFEPKFPIGRIVSRVFLGNSLFAESKRGDWFDHNRMVGVAVAGSSFAHYRSPGMQPWRSSHRSHVRAKCAHELNS
jgi:hypothetical protein